VRVDHALFEGMTVPTEYDPLLAKIVVWGRDRTEALARARRAVRETIVAGIPTSLPFHAHALGEADFAAGRYDTGYVGAHWPRPDGPDLTRTELVAGAIAAVLARQAGTKEAHGRRAGELPSGEIGVWTRSGREDALR
jgi:acetyl/propionyl-CoA carboxylase alpha subunit